MVRERGEYAQQLTPSPGYRFSARCAGPIGGAKQIVPSYLNLDVRPGDANRIARDALPSRCPEDGPGPDVELRPVPGTRHLGPLHRPFGQRPPRCVQVSLKA